MTVGRPECKAVVSAAPRSAGVSARMPSAPIARPIAAKSQRYGSPDAASVNDVAISAPK